MISGAAQADVAVLIISGNRLYIKECVVTLSDGFLTARKGEFETGFEKGGQTREHAMLAKTLGVCQLIVAINKMDDPTCNWSEERFFFLLFSSTFYSCYIYHRYREIEKKLTPYLRSCGYNPAKDIKFLPISGLSGENLKLHVSDPSFASSKNASWYPKSAPTLFTLLDNIKLPERNPKGPLRIPLLEG
jgi:peptide chain release factor subunit 3